MSERTRQPLSPRLQEHVRRLVDEAPPLTPEQRATLAVLLAPSRSRRGTAQPAADRKAA